MQQQIHVRGWWLGGRVRPCLTHVVRFVRDHARVLVAAYRYSTTLSMPGPLPLPNVADPQHDHYASCAPSIRLAASVLTTA